MRGQRVLSDLDVAGYTVHGRVVSNEEFLGTFRKRFNEAYGYELITHGPFVHGLDQPDVVAGFTWDRFRGLQERDVYVFDKSGFVEKLPYYQYEAKYLNDYRVKLWEQLRAHYAERGINLEGIKMSSFYDIEEWIGPEYNRLWFGTSPASGIIGSKGSQPGFPDDLLREPSPGHMLRLLESRRLGGVPGEAVAGNVWAMKRAIDRLGNPDVEGQIIFNLHGRIVEGSFTWEELKYIAEHENPLIRERTRIVIDWYY